MALAIPEDVAATVEIYPDVEPASGTLTFYNPGGTSKLTPDVTVDTVSTTVSSVTDQTTIVVADATGIVAGRQYWWNGSAGAAVRVSEISGTTLTLEAPPPGTIAATHTFVGLRCTATLTAAVLATRSLHYRLEWVITDNDAGDTHNYRQIVHVVATPFRDAVSIDEAARFTSLAFPNYGTGQDWGHWRELARRSSDRVQRALVKSGRYPHLIGDHNAFVDVGLIALRIELALGGLVPMGFDAATYIEEQESSLQIQAGEVIAGLWYDADDSLGVDEATEVRSLYSANLSRL